MRPALVCARSATDFDSCQSEQTLLFVRFGTMAGSGNANSRPDVTRNPATGRSLAAELLQANSYCQGDVGPTDSAISRWQEWSAAHAKTIELCRKQQGLETQLFRIALPSTGADAASHHKRWNDADKSVGYSAAKREEEEAAVEEQKLATALWKAQAVSTLGVCAKLAAIVEHGQWCQDCQDFPWPQLRSALADLFQISQNKDVVRPAFKNRDAADQSSG